MADGDVEAQFRVAVEEWRKKHNLAEDDAVLLLVELLRLHEVHWDELRHRQPPGSPELTAFAERLTEAGRTLEVKMTAALQAISDQRAPSQLTYGLDPWVAVVAVILGAIGAFICGRLIR